MIKSTHHEKLEIPLWACEKENEYITKKADAVKANTAHHEAENTSYVPPGFAILFFVSDGSRPKC